jgi:hypothetical protein
MKRNACLRQTKRFSNWSKIVLPFRAADKLALGLLWILLLCSCTALNNEAESYSREKQKLVKVFLDGDVRLSGPRPIRREL